MARQATKAASTLKALYNCCPFALLSLIALCFSACIQTNATKNNKTNGVIIIEGASFGLGDTLRYILAKEKIDDAISILNLSGGKRGHLMCGNTHEVFEIDTSYRANLIASANVRCSTLQIRDSFYTSSLQIRELISLSNIGEVRIDTIRDSSNLNNWINDKADDSTFIGYIPNARVLYKVTAFLPMYHNQGKTWRAFSRKYDSAAQGKVYSFGFTICDSISTSKDEVAICNTTTNDEIEILNALQIRHIATKVGLIVKAYSTK